MESKIVNSIVNGRFSISRQRKNALKGFSFAIPFLIFFTIFLIYPLIKGFYMSFFEWNLVHPGQSNLIYFDNYINLLHDPKFWKSLRATLYFVALVAPAKIIISVLLALGVYRITKGDYLLKLIFFSPYILPVSVAMLVWAEIYAPSYGPLNYYLSFVVENPPALLDSFDFAMPAVAMASAWWTMGFNFIILLAARQNVPEQLYEAASIDGASSYSVLKDITLPQMKPALTFIVIIQFIGSFRVFGQPYILTDGGPGDATLTMVLYIYRLAFEYHQYGYGAAMGYILFAILVVVSIVNYKVIQG